MKILLELTEPETATIRITTMRTTATINFLDEMIIVNAKHSKVNGGQGNQH
jgi:hypothetical protein